MIDADIDSWKNAAAERAILGILMSEPDEASRIIKTVSPIDFFFPEHQSVFKKAVELHTKNMPVDFVSLLTEQINADLLVTMADESMRVNGVDHLLTLIKTLSMKRYVFNACQSIKATIEKIDAETPQQVRSHVLGLFDKEVPTIEQDNSIVSIVEKMQDSIEKERSGQNKRLVWGMREIDSATGGLWGSELTIIAAGPGTGKTAMAIQIANKIAQQGNVLFVSREMSDVQISKRLVSNLGGINGEKLRVPSKMTDEELDNFYRAASQLSKRGHHIDCTSSTIQEIYDSCRRMIEKDELDLLIVDYLQLLTSARKSESRLQEVNEISRTLKLISLTFDIPVIALSQLSREGQKRSEPTLSDLRESGAIEQDADNVIFLHNPKAEETEGVPKIDVNIIIAKQRSGRTGRVTMTFDKPHMRFYGKEK